MQIKILSWNIWMDGDFKKVSEFLRASRADIIGLQEVVPEDSSRDIISFLTKLGYAQAFSTEVELRLDGRKIGNALFSKYPIHFNKTHILSEEHRRVAVEAGIEVGKVILKVFSVHTMHTHQQESEVLDLQVENLIQVLPKESVIVMGDFNATPDMNPIQRMREVLVDTDPSSAPTWSLYPEGCEVCKPRAVNRRLDYIFASANLKTYSPKVEDATGSDHLPVSVIVEF